MEVAVLAPQVRGSSDRATTPRKRKKLRGDLVSHSDPRDDRDALMHRTPPPKLGVSASAIALIGLLHVVRRRVGDEAQEFLSQWSPIGDVVDALHYQDFDRYHALIEQLVLEHYPLSLIDQCPYCGAFARTFETDCEACFSEEARNESGG